MATDRQRKANRENARHSTGPKSPEGKSRAARNRASHMLTTAGHAILPGEDPAAFDRLKQALLDELEPCGEIESHLVDEMAHSQWKLRRAEAMELDALLRSCEQNPAPRFTDEVARLSRYQASIRRVWNNAFTRLRQLQAERRQALASALDREIEKHADESNPIVSILQSLQSLIPNSGGGDASRTPSPETPPPPPPATAIGNNDKNNPAGPAPQ